MKKIITVVVFLCVIQLTYSQTQDDYDELIEKITVAFNNNDSKEIFNLFSTDYQKLNKQNDFEKMVQTYSKELGKIVSNEFWLEGEKGNCYLLEFNNGTMVLIVKLSETNKITEFTMEEY